MPTYQIQAPNGQTYRIEGPEGATDEQVRAKVLEQFPDAGTPVPPVLDTKGFQQEVLKRVRAGEDPAAIREWAKTVRQPNDESGLLRYDIGPELETVAEQMRGGYTGPVQMQDVTERNAALPSMLRGALDTATFNFADEAQAGLQTGFGLLGDYEATVDQLRAERALDDPTARLAGQLIGGVAAPLAALRVPGAIGRGAQAVERFMQAPSMLSRAARVGTVGAASNVLAGQGAATDERPADILSDVATGAALGVGGQLAGEAILGVNNIVRGIQNPQIGAAQALQEAGLDVADLRNRIAERFRVTGRAPNLLSVLTPDEAGRFTRALSRSPEARTRVLNETEAAMRELGPGMQQRVLQTSPNAPGQQIAPLGQTGASTRAASTPGDIERATLRRADQDFGAFKNEERPLSDIDAIELDRKVFEPLGRVFDSTFMAGLKDRASRGVVKGDDLDKVRRQIARLKRNPDPTKAATIEAIEKDFLGIYQSIFPESTQAVRRYAEGMSAAEGAEMGVRAAKSSTDFIKSVDEMASATDLQKAGIAPGARASLVAQAYGNPTQSYKLASELAQNPGYIDRLTRAVGPQEAQDLAAYAASQKQNIDALMAAARIPADRVEEALERGKPLVDAFAAGFLGGGGAFKAGIINHFLAKANIGRGAANKLADMLLDPAKYNQALAAAQKAGVSNEEVRNAIRNSFVMLAGQVANDNAQMPGNYVTTMNIEEPQ